jgi:hypothetical protein
MCLAKDRDTCINWVEIVVTSNAKFPENEVFFWLVKTEANENLVDGRGCMEEVHVSWRLLTAPQGLLRDDWTGGEGTGIWRGGG